MEQFLKIGNIGDPLVIVQSGRSLVMHSVGDVIIYNLSTYVVQKRIFEYQDSWNGSRKEGVDPAKVTYVCELT